MTEHTNKQFDADLENVRSQFLQMGGVVEAMIQEAIDALASGDMALVDKVREREKKSTVTKSRSTRASVASWPGISPRPSTCAC